MRTRDLTRNLVAGRPSRRLSRQAGLGVLLACIASAALALTACTKEAGMDAVETDANGYLCLKCGVKLYTGRSVFIGPKCPKCGEDTLMPVVGYYCEKDKHLTIRAQRGDPLGAVCEQCQAPLSNAMRSPREKDLKAWGATKPSS